MAPSTEVLVSEGEAETAIVGHLFATVDENVDVVGIVERFRPAPNDGKSGCDVGGLRRIRKLHVIAVDCVAQQLSAHVRHTSLDVELAHEIRLYDKLGNVLHLYQKNNIPLINFVFIDK